MFGQCMHARGHHQLETHSLARGGEINSTTNIVRTRANQAEQCMHVWGATPNEVPRSSASSQLNTCTPAKCAADSAVAATICCRRFTICASSSGQGVGRAAAAARHVTSPAGTLESPAAATEAVRRSIWGGRETRQCSSMRKIDAGALGEWAGGRQQRAR